MDYTRVYSQKQIKVYIIDRKLYLVNGSQTLNPYPIAVGKPETPTPTGTFHIINKIVNPGGMLGTRWMGLDIPNGPYGIHGTFQPDSIGKAISNGCIRLYNQNAEELFGMVRIGTTVVIKSSLNYPDNSLTYNGNTKYTTYLVQSGDTLWGIAQKYNVSLENLMLLNQIDDPNNLQVGMEIKIPI